MCTRSSLASAEASRADLRRHWPTCLQQYSVAVARRRSIPMWVLGVSQPSRWLPEKGDTHQILHMLVGEHVHSHTMVYGLLLGILLPAESSPHERTSNIKHKLT